MNRDGYINFWNLIRKPIRIMLRLKDMDERVTKQNERTPKEESFNQIMEDLKLGYQMETKYKGHSKIYILRKKTPETEQTSIETINY